MPKAYSLTYVRKTYRDFIKRSANNVLVSVSALGADIRMPEKKVLDPHLISPGRTIDMGCGNGRLFYFLRSRKQEIYGIDACRDFIRQIKNTGYYDADNNGLARSKNRK